MKQFLIVFLLISCLSHAQVNEISFEGAQAKANTLTSAEKETLEQRFKSKFPDGISQDMFQNQLNKVYKNKYDYYLARKGGYEVISTLAEMGIDMIPGEKFKQKLLKKLVQKTHKNAADWLDPSKAKAQRTAVEKKAIVEITLQRFNYEFKQPGNSEAHVMQLRREFEESDGGKQVMKDYGNDVFELAYDAFRNDVLHSKVASQVEYTAQVDRSNREQAQFRANFEKYKDTVTRFMAALLTAEQANAIATQNINERVKRTNEEVRRLNASVDELKNQGRSFQTELTAIKSLTLRNSLDLHALKVATNNNTESLIRLGEDVLEIKGAVYQINRKVDDLSKDLKEMKLRGEWNELPLDAQIYALENSNKFDGFFKDRASKDSVLSDYKAVMNRQNNIKTLNNAIAYGSVALQAMEQFNIGSKDLRRTLGYAIEITGIAANAYTGNYAQAISSTLNLIGGAKADPNQQMMQAIMRQIQALHEDMMKQFNMVHRSLQVIHEDMTAWFQHINKQLIMVREQLDDMQAENNRNFAQVMLKLNIIENQNNCTQRLLHEYFNFYERCYSSFGNDVNFPLTGKAHMYVKFGEGHAECVRQLSSGTAGSLENTSLFDNTDCDESMKLLPLYKSVMNTWRESQDRQRRLNTSLGYLVYAPKSFVDADKFYANTYQVRDSFSSSRLNVLFRPENFTNVNAVRLRNTVKVNTMGSYLLHFLPYLELYNSGSGRLIDPADTISAEKLGRLKTTLREMINVADVAIAQNLFLAGNNLVNHVEEIVREESKINGSDERLATIFELLKASPYFEKNLSLYYTLKYFKTKEAIDEVSMWARNNPNRYRPISDSNDWILVYSGHDGRPYFEIQSGRPIKLSQFATTKQLATAKIEVAVDDYALGLTDFVFDERILNLMMVKRRLEDKLEDYEDFGKIPMYSSTEIDKQDILYLLSIDN